jgi:hypothetical protein
MSGEYHRKNEDFSLQDLFVLGLYSEDEIDRMIDELQGNDMGRVREQLQKLSRDYQQLAEGQTKWKTMVDQIQYLRERIMVYQNTVRMVEKGIEFRNREEILSKLLYEASKSMELLLNCGVCLDSLLQETLKHVREVERRHKDEPPYHLIDILER